MGTSSNSSPTQYSAPRKKCEDKNPRSKSFKSLRNCRHSVWLMMEEGTCALDPDVQPCVQIPELLH